MIQIPDIPLPEDSDDYFNHENIPSEDNIEKVIVAHNSMKFYLSKMRTTYNCFYCGQTCISALYIPEDTNVDVYIHDTGYTPLYITYNPNPHTSLNAKFNIQKWCKDIKDDTHDLHQKEILENILKLSKSINIDENFNREREIYRDGITYVRHTVIFPYLPFVNASSLYLQFNHDTDFYMEIKDDVLYDDYPYKLLWNDNMVFGYDNRDWKLNVKYCIYKLEKLRYTDIRLMNKMVCDEMIKYRLLVDQNPFGNKSIRYA